MKEKIKKIIFGYLPGFILGLISACTISVIAATYFPSNDVTYDNSTSGLSSTNVQGAIDELYGVCFPPSAGDSILDNTDIVTSGDGLYEDEYEEGKYTYKGANPNNYVTFNNEYAGWRIISINSDGTIKITRNASIGNRAWSNSGNSNWNFPANLNTYLNEDYYNSLNSTAQIQIVKAIYYVGGVTEDNDDMQDQINDEKAVTSEVKVALPTVSEYLRANSNKSQCGTFKSNNNNISTCSNSNWMSNTSYYWLTLSHADAGYIFRVKGNIYGEYSGYVERISASDTSQAIRPAITLSSEVQITGGDGSLNSPYEIEI